MLEIPESHAWSEQANRLLPGRTIRTAVANASPHGFAWFYGDPEAYAPLLVGRTLGQASPAGGMLEIQADGATLLFADGVALRLYAPEVPRPSKHQLLLEFEDGFALACSVRMYGGLWAYPAGMNENPYYLGGLRKPSPLTDAFDAPYFERLLAGVKPGLSAKAFLATEQRIPGLGNGVLQDILLRAGIHPQRALSTLSDADVQRLWESVKGVLRQMADEGGRDTESDLLGKPGGNRTLLSRKTSGHPCLLCGSPLERRQYLGGKIYYCPACQPLS